MDHPASDRHRAYLARSLGSHAAFTLQYHLVWSVLARRPLLVGTVALRLEQLLHEAAQRAGITILALHIEPEHLHVLVSLTPDHSVAQVVHRLKGATAQQLRAASAELRAAHPTGLWNTGYFVRTLGDVNVAQARAYLDRQRSHHHHEDALGSVNVAGAMKGEEGTVSCAESGMNPALGQT